MTTTAALRSHGRCLSRAVTAARPPAEAPMPTTGKRDTGGPVVCPVNSYPRLGRVEAGWPLRVARAVALVCVEERRLILRGRPNVLRSEDGACSRRSYFVLTSSDRAGAAGHRVE